MTEAKSGLSPISFTNYVASAPATFLQVCDCKALITHEEDMEMSQKYRSWHLLTNPAKKTKISLLEGWQSFGWTGNNLIEILHSLKYGRDNGYIVAIRYWAWPMHKITDMWMVIQDDIDLWTSTKYNPWRQFVEQLLCVKIVIDKNDLGLRLI